MSFLDNFALTWDFGLAAVLFFTAFFYGLTAGGGKLALFLESLYFSWVLVGLAPQEIQFLVEIGLFVGIAVLLFFFLAGSGLHSALRPDGHRGGENHWWRLILLSLAISGFLFSSLLAFLPENEYHRLSSITAEIFLHNGAHFWWALGGVVALIFLRKTQKQ